LKRIMIPLPFISPKISSGWLLLVTPIYYRIGRKLIDSIKYPTIVRDTRGEDFCDYEPMGMADSIKAALFNEDHEFALTKWSSAFSSTGIRKSWAGTQFRTRLIDFETVSVKCSPENAFKPIMEIGGRNGWYFLTWLWKLRGILDLIVGGVGHRRGRIDPKNLRKGDTLDWWRVEEVTPNRLLRLYSEMRLPGRAWLEFEVFGDENLSTIRQTAIFDPVGVRGLAYWYSLYPIHKIVFRGMIRAIAKRALMSMLNL
jgi:hypothetical protein